jgi:hypothetical protein
MVGFRIKAYPKALELFARVTDVHSTHAGNTMSVKAVDAERLLSTRANRCRSWAFANVIVEAFDGEDGETCQSRQLRSTSMFSSIQNPRPVSERYINPFLSKRSAKFNRQLVQHRLDCLVGQMS